MSRIDAIKARAEKATPGSWVTDERTVMTEWVDPEMSWRGRTYISTHVGYDPDREFIAHARDDVPFLLERVDQLEQKLVRQQAAHVEAMREKDATFDAAYAEAMQRIEKLERALLAEMPPRNHGGLCIGRFDKEAGCDCHEGAVIARIFAALSEDP